MIKPVVFWLHFLFFLVKSQFTDWDPDLKSPKKQGFEQEEWEDREYWQKLWNDKPTGMNIEITNEDMQMPDDSAFEDIWSAALDPRLSIYNIKSYQNIVDQMASSISTKMSFFESKIESFANSIISVHQDHYLTQYAPVSEQFDMAHNYNSSSIKNFPVACDKIPMSEGKQRLEIYLSNNQSYNERYNIYQWPDALEIEFKRKNGYIRTVDEKHSCIFTQRECYFMHSDCPMPKNQDHDHIYRAFNAEALESIRNVDDDDNQSQSLNSTIKSAIKSVHFTTMKGVTVINPAQSINNVKEYRHHYKKYTKANSYQDLTDMYMKDMRYESFFRDSINNYSELGMDIIFYLDKSSTMAYNHRNNRAADAIISTIRNLKPQDRFTVMATSKVSLLHCKQIFGSSFGAGDYLPGFENVCNSERNSTSKLNNWNYNAIPEKTDEEIENLEILVPQYSCMKGNLAYATKDIKDKSRFFIQRDLLMNDGYNYINFQGLKDYAAAFAQMSDIFRAANENLNKESLPKTNERDVSNRSKIVIFITDGEPIDSSQEINSMAALAKLQKEFDYDIQLKVFNLGNQYQFLNRMAEQDYDVFVSKTTSDDMIHGHVEMVNVDAHHSRFADQMYMSLISNNPNSDTSASTKWSWNNPIFDDLTLATQIHEEQVVTVSKAIFDSEDNLIGVLGMDLSAKYLFGSVEELSFDGNLPFVIESGSLNIVRHPELRAIQDIVHLSKSFTTEDFGTGGFSTTVELSPNLIDNTIYYQFLENSPELKEILKNPTNHNSGETRIFPNSRRTIFCSNSENNHYLICIKVTNHQSQNIENSGNLYYYSPVLKNTTDLAALTDQLYPGGDGLGNNRFIRVNQNIEDHLHKHLIPLENSIQTGFTAYNKKWFDQKAKPFFHEIFGIENEIRICNYNGRYLYSAPDYLLGQTDWTMGNIFIKDMYYEDNGVTEPEVEHMLAFLNNQTNILSSDSNEVVDHTKILTDIGLKTNYVANSNFTLSLFKSLSAVKSILSIDQVMTSPAIATNYTAKPIRKLFRSTNGLSITIPALLQESDYDLFDLQQSTDYHYSAVEYNKDGFGATVSVSKKVKVSVSGNHESSSGNNQQRHVGNLIYTYNWSDFFTLIRSKIFQNTEFYKMCPHLDLVNWGGPFSLIRYVFYLQRSGREVYQFDKESRNYDCDYYLFTKSGQLIFYKDQFQLRTPSNSPRKVLFKNLQLTYQRELNALQGQHFFDLMYDHFLLTDYTDQPLSEILKNETNLVRDWNIAGNSLSVEGGDGSFSLESTCFDVEQRQIYKKMKFNFADGKTMNGHMREHNFPEYTEEKFTEDQKELQLEIANNNRLDSQWMDVDSRLNKNHWGEEYYIKNFADTNLYLMVIKDPNHLYSWINQSLSAAVIGSEIFWVIKHWRKNLKFHRFKILNRKILNLWYKRKSIRIREALINFNYDFSNRLKPSVLFSPCDHSYPNLVNNYTNCQKTDQHSRKIFDVDRFSRKLVDKPYNIPGIFIDQCTIDQVTQSLKPSELDQTSYKYVRNAGWLSVYIKGLFPEKFIPLKNSYSFIFIADIIEKPISSIFTWIVIILYIHYMIVYLNQSNTFAYKLAKIRSGDNRIDWMEGDHKITEDQEDQQQQILLNDIMIKYNSDALGGEYFNYIETNDLLPAWEGVFENYSRFRNTRSRKIIKTIQKDHKLAVFDSNTTFVWGV